ncbi:hypothetical protein KO533_11715 [Shewanella sp. NKUCC05_KAH]|uniref:hypothetical protein n=1 Tax=Shewanella sp. NKUCC05_KAH TaxID=2842126 RepID=UPI001C5AD52C|nr:hypothetical protein [Shewanella sp. NKUCC05_KAH]MBW3527227.1 hypothetical protein [Shewanella sp. NKUCC05_KAH]
MKGFDAHTASLAGTKSAQARRTMKVYKEQHRAAMIDKAESLVSDFMDGKAVLGITLSPEIRAKIIENVISEVTTQSLIGALKHRDELDLIMLKHELMAGDSTTGNIIDGDTDDNAAMLTNTELMALLGTSYEQRNGNEKPEHSISDESFFDWFNRQSFTCRQSILDINFDSNIDVMMNYAGQSAKSVTAKLKITNVADI